jgi:NADPH:quinone reductase
MDLPMPRPDRQQVLIEVHAAGVNFPDTLIIEGKYQYKPEFPFSPGGEVAGIVRAVGSDVVGLAPGDRVLAPLGWGGYAEAVLAEAWRVLKIPDEMDFETASAFVLTYGTSHHALKDRAQLAPKETLLVLGAAGGVGLAAIEIGKAMGARVIAAASSDEKLQVCREHGADECINYVRDDLRDAIKTLTDNRGVDVVYDPVGGDLCDPALRGMAWNGRYLVVGFASGQIPAPPLNLPLLKGCSLVGVFWGAFARKQPERNAANMVELFQWFGQGQVRPHICARYPLPQAAEAMRAVMNRQAKGKVILTVPR